MSDEYNDVNCSAEAVVQYSDEGTFLTLTKVGASEDFLFDSAIFYGEVNGKIEFKIGCGGGGQGWFWTLFSMPVTFADRDTWQLMIGNYTRSYQISWMGDVKVGSETYEDCVRIHVNNTEEKQVLSIKGLGEIYLSKGIGIIRYDFSRSGLEGNFTAEILEYGELPARTISGRLTLDGEEPVEGYRVGLAYCGQKGINADNTDSGGKFSIQVFGHSPRIRYGPLRIEGNLTQICEPRSRKIENTTGDISDLELSMRYIDLAMGPSDLAVHVINEKGNDLANADVTLSVRGWVIASTSTNGTGHSEFMNLPNDTYSIKVRLEGYEDRTTEATLASGDKVETITLHSIPFIETPLGMATVSGAIIAVIWATTFIVLRRRKKPNL